LGQKKPEHIITIYEICKKGFVNLSFPKVTEKVSKRDVNKASDKTKQKL
jgi:hypothetical protein